MARSRNRLYSAALYLLVPWALCHLVWRGLRYRPYLRRWPERFGFGPHANGEPVIWVHAVSVGEVRTSVRLIEALMERFPGHRVLVTTMTPTGSEQVQQLLGDRVMHCYVPYDLPGAVQRFLARYRPDYAFIVETEFWPNIFRICHEHGIPLLLVNVRVSPKSFKGYSIAPRFTQRMLSCVRMMAVQSDRDAERLLNLGVDPAVIRLTGNLKFDIRLPDGIEVAGRRLRALWGSERKVWIAASTHEGEEQAVLEAFADIRHRHPTALLVLVPRHPERFSHVARLCRRGGLRVALRSEQPGNLPIDTDVLVGDTMGELLYLYAASDVAFIGGSLIPHGGQNLVEAMAVGVPAIFGPHMFNFEQSSTIALVHGAACQISGADQLAPTVEAYLDDQSLRERAASAARKVFDENHGSLDKTLEFLDYSLLDPGATLVPTNNVVRGRFD
ncbi:MAG: lipid IV(A) 3-deoxy-D-manno-octulosonic acid transferase [Gammaproteobacteria bacterium]|nr:lipid IV(A) 3-deoxy-D-manno-octulosonic acid transferase [Gammaproteobacteria bacterium]MDH4254635.1 lipid IV(A) 3-deoxy-D-manno-octulosonic acid transferase [Gammaproteobacteria bacterium]MDH5309463.1 lipid IV(A) 3-deoxy-D-manno-octulosonic acid transferase [Gammaproteobacteria bacterium]